MKRTLEFVAAELKFMFNANRFRFVDSVASEVFGDNSYVVLESSRVRARVTNDRGQIFVEFQCLESDRPGEWYSTDIVRGAITGHIGSTSVADRKTVEFLEVAIEEIELLFSGDPKKTRDRLRSLQRQRAKRQFLRPREPQDPQDP